MSHEADIGMSEKFGEMMALLADQGGLAALRAACLALAALVAAEMPEEMREQFMFDLLKAFADGVGGKVVMDPPARGGLH